MTDLTRIKTENNRKAAFAIVLCALSVISTFIAVIGAFFEPETEGALNGLDVLEYFTFESNIINSICSLLCVPYYCDGIRSGNMHMPRWIVHVFYISVTATTMTFLTALCVMSPVSGFISTMLGNSNLYLHTLSPLLSFITFCFVASYHNIRKRFIAIAVIPEVIYFAVYLIMVFGFGKWEDFYFIRDISVPRPVVAAILIFFAAVCAALVRMIHNSVHKREKRKYFENYASCAELSKQTAAEAVRALASENRKTDSREGDVTVPRRLIDYLRGQYGEQATLEDLCGIYISEYLHADTERGNSHNENTADNR